MSSVSSRVYQHPVVSIRVVSSQGASGLEYCQWDSVQSTASKRSIYNQYRWEKSQSSVYPVLTRVLLVRSIVGRANLRISLQVARLYKSRSYERVRAARTVKLLVYERVRASEIVQSHFELYKGWHISILQR